LSLVACQVWANGVDHVRVAFSRLTLFRLLLIAFSPKCVAIHFRAITVSDGHSQVLLNISGLPMQSRGPLQFPAEEFFLARVAFVARPFV
jgi:hypothetical protein